MLRANRYVIRCLLPPRTRDNEQTLFNMELDLIEDCASSIRLATFYVAPEGRASFLLTPPTETTLRRLLLREFIAGYREKVSVLPGRAGRAISGISMEVTEPYALPSHTRSSSPQSAPEAALILSPKAISLKANRGIQ